MNKQKLELLARLLKEDKITVDDFVILVSEEQTQIVYPVIQPNQQQPLMPFYYGSGTNPVYCGNTLTTNFNPNEQV